jgi:hypothetical protein
MTTRFNDQIDALLTAIADEGSDAVEQALQIYDVNDIMAVVAKRLLDVEASGGGGFMPARSVGQATFEAHNVVAAGSDFTHVPWVFAQGDEDMIDLTTPTLPVPVDGGVYAYLFTIVQQGGGDGSPFYGTLLVDSDFYALTLQDSRLGLASSEYPQGNLPLVAPPWFSAAGSGFQATIGNGGVRRLGHVRRAALHPASDVGTVIEWR